jgi:PhnB protein
MSVDSKGQRMDSDSAGITMRSLITPWLNVRKSAQAVEFYMAAFGAKVVYKIEHPDGNVVARLSVEGAEFWVGDESPEHLNFSPDAMFARAVTAGASVVYPVSEEHGWRVGRVTDPYGHQWEIGRPVAHL